MLSREEVVNLASKAGFGFNFIRGEVARFETLARLIVKEMENKDAKKEDN